jgi:uncharacterized protein (TIGR00266 family)
VSPFTNGALQQEQHAPPEGLRLFSTRSNAIDTTDSNDDSSNSNNNNLPDTLALPGKLIDLSTSAKIEGEESHVATVTLVPGETLRAESGAMLFMTEGVSMETQLAGASAAFSRMLTGQNVFLTDFTYQGTTTGTVCLGTDFPSKILRLHLADYANSNLICQRGAYLASNPTVSIEMEFTKSFSAGFFGGQGFVLQKLSGPGDVLIKGGGTVIQKDLLPGERLRVTSGSIVAFESSVEYDIQMLPGIKNAMFGGEGLFVTTLQGPGQVWLQGMPPDRMIAEISRRMPSGGGLGIPMGLGGGVGGDGEGVAEGETSGDTAGAGEEAVAATDAAVAADRQATVASSGLGSDAVDGDSPSALFGDAAAQDATSTTPEAVMTDDSSFGSSSTEPSFTDEDFASTTQGESGFDEASFEDEFSNDASFNDGELFDDTTSSESMSMGQGTEEEGGSGLLQTLWDLFMNDDNE